MSNGHSERRENKNSKEKLFEEVMNSNFQDQREIKDLILEGLIPDQREEIKKVPT